METNLESLESVGAKEPGKPLDLHKQIDFTKFGLKKDAFNPHEQQNFWENDTDYPDDGYDDDAQDEESVDARIWDSDTPYEEMTEEQQWAVDNPDYLYEDAQQDDEFDDGHRIKDWQEYRDAKLNSDNPDDFMSYEEWKNEKDAWEEDHPDGPPYSEAVQDFQNTEPNGQTELANWRQYREEKDNSNDPDSFPSYEEWKKNQENDDSSENKPSVEIDGKECKTDDSGKVYFEDGKLKPNCEYTLNGYNYETDDKGRIIKASGKITIPETKVPRPPRLPDIEDRNRTDDRGHLIAHEFGGADTEGNLVPMDSDLNQNGDYRIFEKELKEAAQAGKDVSVTIEPQYEGDSKRPTSFVVTYTIDGETFEKTFKNEPPKGAQ